jgi:predicted CoA-binding protein
MSTSTSSEGNQKKTVVLGASPNPSRVAYMAVEQMKSKGIEVVPVGIRKGAIAGELIRLGRPEIEEVHTVSLYVGPRLQKEQDLYTYVLEVLRPERIIFNPGTENPEFMKLARDKNIEVLPACTLIMLSLNSF